MTIETFTPEETFELGEQLGQKARPGEVYCLDGDLGTGKTVFTQGFAKGLGIEGPVSSPTFTIIQQYDEGRLPLYHRGCSGRYHFLLGKTLPAGNQSRIRQNGGNGAWRFFIIQ